MFRVQGPGHQVFGVQGSGHQVFGAQGPGHQVSVFGWQPGLAMCHATAMGDSLPEMLVSHPTVTQSMAHEFYRFPHTRLTVDSQPPPSLHDKSAPPSQHDIHYTYRDKYDKCKMWDKRKCGINV